MKTNLFLLLALLFFTLNANAQVYSSDEGLALQNGQSVWFNSQTSTAKSEVLRLDQSSQFACDSLSTLFASNNGLSGCMFDVVATTTLEIQYLYGNFATGTSDCAILYKQGSHIGFEGDATAWSILGNASVTSVQDVPAFIPIAINLTMLPGDTLAFYVAKTSGSANVKYTDGTLLSSVYSTNGSISILEGTGVNYPFAFAISPRIWNGTVVYCESTVGIQDPVAGADLFSVRANANEGIFYVQVSDNLFHENASVLFLVFDITGRQILKEAMNLSEKSFLTKPLPEGVYICSLQSGSEVLQQKKIVIH